MKKYRFLFTGVYIIWGYLAGFTIWQVVVLVASFGLLYDLVKDEKEKGLK